jgi:Flp pilus assembly CpaE family ATPase
MTHSDDPVGNGTHESPSARNGSGRRSRQDKHTIEIRLPRESLDLKFQVASGATDSKCKLIAFLSPKGGSGKTVLGTNLGRILQSCNPADITFSYATPTLPPRA